MGSVLEPVPALALLTFITASGSLFSYLLSRPLAPLIAVLFPKPLAFVRAALAPESILPPTSSQSSENDAIASQMSDLSTAPNSGPEVKSSIWRRLLIMRAMGFVPWSGMNVACGVVGVDWKTFWLTTAAGSASWSYVTASVGNILSHLALPSASLAPSAIPGNSNGDSLTSLLRNPSLILKLVFLSVLTLLPVVLKRRSPISATGDSMEMITDTSKLSQVRLVTRTESLQPPVSPLSRPPVRKAPIPASFDLVSFGRTVARQGGKIVLGGAKNAAGGAQRLTSGVAR